LLCVADKGKYKKRLECGGVKFSTLSLHPFPQGLNSAYVRF
jgi:hypothetical protein